jgi:hypothetical protein
MQRFGRSIFFWLVAVAVVGTPLVPTSVSADPVTTWSPGPGAVGDDTYDGFIDVPTANATVSTGNFSVSGWFVDTTADGWAGADDIQIWQGTMDGGGTKLAEAAFGQSRPDVATATGNPFWANSGYTGVVPPGSLAAGPATLSVYAHTPSKGWWFKQVQVTVSTTVSTTTTPTSGASAYPIVAIEMPKDGQIVFTNSDYTAQGYALDQAAAPNQGVAGTGIDKVDVYLNPREQGGVFLGTADLGFSDSAALVYGPQFADAGWRLTFKPTSFHDNSYLLVAYAHSVVTGRENSVSRFFVIKEPNT